MIGTCGTAPVSAIEENIRRKVNAPPILCHCAIFSHAALLLAFQPQQRMDYFQHHFFMRLVQ